MKLIEFFNEDMTPNWEMFEKTFPDMATCGHSMHYHSEGSPLNHTKLVADVMYDTVKQHIGTSMEEYYIIMMSAALFHDIGKPLTTNWDEKQKDWCCKSHGEAGEHLFRNMFFEEHLDLREKVAYLIRYHMLLHHILLKTKECKEREFVQLMNGLMPFEDMLLLHECDLRGSINKESTDEKVAKHIFDIRTAIEQVKSEGLNNIWKDVSKNTAKMYVMIGIPGSGKSTYAEHLKITEKINSLVDLPIISRDTVRIEMGLCGDGEKCMGSNEEEKEVTRIVENKIKALSKKGMSFIVDNTSLKRKYREQYANYIKDYDIVPVFIYVEAPSLTDNFKRRNGQIKEHIIQYMWNSMEFPHRSECYELRLIDQNNDSEYIL